MNPRRTVGDGPQAKVIVKCYSDLAGKKRGLTTPLTTLFEDQFVGEVETPQCGFGEFEGGERA